MTKVQRKIVRKNEWVIEHAIDANLNSPSETILSELKNGTWENGDSESYPDEYLPKVRMRFLDLIGRLATGEELPFKSYNRLRLGIWELKASNARITFYDTPGDGTFTPKLGIKQWHGTEPYWELPEELDDYIRLGACWEKVDEKALESDIEDSLRVRKEDIEHDAN